MAGSLAQSVTSHPRSTKQPVTLDPSPPGPRLNDPSLHQPRGCSPPPLSGQFQEPLPQRSIVCSLPPVAEAGSVRAQGPASPALRHRPPLAHVAHGLAESGGPYQSFYSTCFSTSTSSAWFATSFFRRRFSSSIARSRLASLASTSPYLRFRLYNVSWLTPSRRHSSPVPAPRACSLKAVTIRSSLNRLCAFVLLSPLWGLSYRRTVTIPGPVPGGTPEPEPSDCGPERSYTTFRALASDGVVPGPTPSHKR